VNKGDLKIMSSTNVYFENAYTNDGNHLNNGALYLKGDFINNGTTAIPTSGTTFFKSTTNAIQSISGTTGSANFFKLEIDNSLTGVSVADGFGLIVEDAVALTKGDLRLVGEAQLVQTHTTANANTSGTGKLLRDQQGITTTTGYNYWSSPVNNSGTFALNGGLFDGTDASINSFSPQQIGFNSGSPYNGVSAITDGIGNVTTPLKINERWLYTYSRSTLEYAGWYKIDKNSPIKPGEGFSMKGTGAVDQNYVFKGVPNNGTYSFPIALGESILLGNPYPSALDADIFLTENSGVIEQLEFWVDGGSPSHYLADYLGGYAILNLTTGTPPSALPTTPDILIAGLGSFTGRFAPTQYIPVAQGFFVKATANGTISFNNGQRIFKKEGGTDSYFYKNANTKSEQKTNIENKSIIRIGYEDPEKFHRQLALGFVPNSNADLNYNRGYDAIMSGPREDELFFIIENDVTKKYVIQGVNAFDENNEFDLGLIITEAGEHTIMLDAVENFNGKVYIKDVLSNITYNLSEGKFKPMLPPGTYLDRFKLVFRDKSATIVAEDLVSSVNASPEKTTVYYQENESLIVRTKNDLKVNNIAIYNMLGQQIKQVIGNELGKNVFAIPFHYPIGVYLVIVESELGKETFKIINK
jgi:hypothetical protein